MKIFRIILFILNFISFVFCAMAASYNFEREILWLAIGDIIVAVVNLIALIIFTYNTTVDFLNKKKGGIDG